MTKLEAIAASKQFRKELDDILQRMKQFRRVLTALGMGSHFAGEFEDAGEVIAQHTISCRDLESAIMRQGLVLKHIGNPDPYPESRNPASPVVEPTADGLKL